MGYNRDIAYCLFVDKPEENDPYCEKRICSERDDDWVSHDQNLLDVVLKVFKSMSAAGSADQLLSVVARKKLISEASM